MTLCSLFFRRICTDHKRTFKDHAKNSNVNSVVSKENSLFELCLLKDNVK